MSAERIQKILSKFGVASRRKAEEMITEGLVTVNGQVAVLGQKADIETDAIKVSGKLLNRTDAPSHLYLAFFKPKAVISTLDDPEGRPSISGYLTKLKTKVYPIGRLDFNSEGLILLTNDGTVVEQIQKNVKIPRVYHVKVKGHPKSEDLDRLRRGGRLEGRLISPYRVKVAKRLDQKSVVEIVLIGAGSFDLKTFFEHKGFLVEKMTRVAIGQIQLKGLAPGEYRQLEKTQIEALISQPDLGLLALDREETDRQEELELRDAKKEGDASRGGRGPKRRPFAEKRPYGEKRSFTGRPSFDRDNRGDRSNNKEKRPYGAKRAFSGERRSEGEQREFSSEKRPFREKRSYGEKREYSGQKRPYGEKRPYYSAEKRPYGEKRTFGEKRPVADRPRGDRDERKGGYGMAKKGFGTQKRFGGRPGGPRRDAEGSDSRSSGGFRPLRGKLRAR